MKHRPIPIIDLFAGPGGLGEGFSAFLSDGLPGFDVRLSIEKDAVACNTLRLRKFFRAFENVPAEYHAHTRGEMDLAALFSAHPKAATFALSRTWQAELGKVRQSLVYAKVRAALGRSKSWVLLGGPPCQAYSIAGRARMGKRSDFEDDERHFLYREYLRIVAKEQPTVFVMENVKGLLSATHSGSRIFDRIQDDLRQPGRAVKNRRAYGLVYDLYAIGHGDQIDTHRDSGPSFLVRAEDYGIPQARHRVFIVGVRRGIGTRPARLEQRKQTSVSDVLSDLPVLRSELSREMDSQDSWWSAVGDVQKQAWFKAGANGHWADVVRHAKSIIAKRSPPPDIGAKSMPYSSRPATHSRWYRDNAEALTMHEARSHMRSDLWRYFFCACYAAVRGESPGLRDFPRELLPAHKNVQEAMTGPMFGDRFRVQIAGHPSSTVTSHIAKDGHYFIHYDPIQCRSLTAREAARLQTFPDSYFFEGGRTEQFHQIGNAVPPLLAREIAKVVYDLLKVAN